MLRGVYDTMDLFTDEIRIELERRGHKVLLLRMDHMDADLQELMVLAGDGGIRAVITFNNLGYNMGEEQGGNLWEALGATYVNIMMDHPFHYDKQLKNMPANTLLCCIDRRHVDYARRFYPNVERVIFLPHGGCFRALESIDEVACRDIDVLYAGNLSRFLIEQLIPDFGQFAEVDGVALSESVLKKLIMNPFLTTEEVLEEELKKMLGEDLSEEKLLYYITEFRFLDGFATSYYRERSLQVLVESGIRVHVLGLGWERCDWTDDENFIHLGKVDAEEVLPYMRRSKIVLNTLTWFKDGSHDRIYNGMLSGAAVVSDDSPFLLESLQNGSEAELFNLSSVNELPSKVGGLLGEPNRLQEMAEAGRLHAEKYETWSNRVEILLQVLSEV